MPFLGEIELSVDIRQHADAGKPFDVDIELIFS